MSGFGGKGGHRLRIAKCPLMTQSGHHCRTCHMRDPPRSVSHFLNGQERSLGAVSGHRADRKLFMISLNIVLPGSRWLA